MLTLSQLQRGLVKSSTIFKNGDLMRLLQITGMTSQEAVDNGKDWIFKGNLSVFKDGYLSVFRNGYGFAYECIYMCLYRYIFVYIYYCLYIQ